MKRAWPLLGASLAAAAACGESSRSPGTMSAAGSAGAPGAAGHAGTLTNGGASGGSSSGNGGTAGMSAAGAGEGGASGGEGGAACEPSSPNAVACADEVEGAFLARWSVTSEDGATSTLSAVPGAAGQALRLSTESGFLVTLRYEAPLVTTKAQSLRLLLRAANQNTGWQGNVPVITLEDDAGQRRSYTPSSPQYPLDGATWVELRVPLAGGAGWTVSADPVDFGQLVALELTADTWEAGYRIDVDGLGFVDADAACAVTCENACHGRGECSAEQLGCVCEVGATGPDCNYCRDGFVLRSGHCALIDDGDFDVWPNAVSRANSDAWLQVHHERIRRLEPRVLALNFANPSDAGEVQALLEAVVAGFREGSRPRGAGEGAEPGLEYQLLPVVDLRDGESGHPPAPSDYPYENSTLYPRRAAGEAGAWGLDYAALFSAEFAPHYGFEDPNQGGRFLSLCELVESGQIHELWLVGSGDVPDASAAEVLEHKLRYDAGHNPLVGTFDACAGNGCFDADVPHCARSVRIGFVNYSRGPGCYLHSQGHGLESTARRRVLPPLSDWFLPFAGFDLDRRYGLPGASFYELLGEQNHAAYPTPDELVVHREGTTTSVPDYVAGCGNVHFPPNAGNHYEYGSVAPVRSDCDDFGLEVASCRPRATASISAPAWAEYESLSPDCGGAFLVWWFQHMPGFGSQQRNAAGQRLPSVWPYLFY